LGKFISIKLNSERAFLKQLKWLDDKKSSNKTTEKERELKTKKIVKLSKITIQKIYWQIHGERKKNHYLNVSIIGTSRTWVFFTCCSWIPCICSSSFLRCCTIFCTLLLLHLQSCWSANASFFAYIFL